MSDERAITTIKADAPAEWHRREEVAAMGQRIKTMLPGGNVLSDTQAMALAQYSLVMDLNPFRGEVYGFPGRGGQLCLVDGYKAMVRWAKEKAPYVEKYEDLPLEDGQLHHIRCWILRDDRKAQIGEWVNMGAPWREAFELVASFADGTVLQSETQKGNKDYDPPTGWTWEQVARKRALKNALNLSHGAPSPREVAAMSWRVNGVKTLPEDWDGTPAQIVEAGKAADYAEQKARTRETLTAWEQMTDQERQAKAAENSEALYGPPDFEGFDDEPEDNGPTWGEVFGAGEADDFEPPPDFLIVKVPKGDYAGKNLAWLLENDIDYVARIAAESRDKELKECAIAALKWHEAEEMPL